MDINSKNNLDKTLSESNLNGESLKLQKETLEEQGIFSKDDLVNTNTNEISIFSNETEEVTSDTLLYNIGEKSNFLNPIFINGTNREISITIPNGEHFFENDPFTNSTNPEITEPQEAPNPDDATVPADPSTTDSTDDVNEVGNTTGIEINIDQSEREIQAKINDLTDAEKEVYLKYAEMIEGINTDGIYTAKLQEKTLEFLSTLSDEEIANFINAYGYVHSEEGGFSNLFFTMIFGLNVDELKHTPRNKMPFTNMYSESEYSGQIQRIVNLLSDENKDQIIDDLVPIKGACPSYIENYLTALFTPPEERSAEQSLLLARPPKFLSSGDLINTVREM